MEPGQPLYNKWLGSPVIISYSRGPSWINLENPYEVAQGALEGREALFLLEQTGPIGVGVRRILEGEGDSEELGILLFLPWGAINAMYSAVAEESE